MYLLVRKYNIRKYNGNEYGAKSTLIYFTLNEASPTLTDCMAIHANLYTRTHYSLHAPFISHEGSLHADGRERGLLDLSPGNDISTEELPRRQQLDRYALQILTVYA